MSDLPVAPVSFLCYCGGRLGPDDRLLDDLYVCRDSDHWTHRDTPVVWRLVGATVIRPAAWDADRIAARLLDAECDLVEIIRTGSTSRPDAKAHHGAGDPGRSLPDGAVAGTKVGPENRRQLASELRRIAADLDRGSNALDARRSQQIADRVARAFGDMRREAEDRERTYLGTGPLPRLGPHPRER